jgi:zinc and cadmium transporter
MTALGYIIVFGVAMSAIALVGTVTLVLRQETLSRALLPLVAFAAGSLIGGALFHMIPASVQELGNTLTVYIWIAAGFLLFLGLEQFIHWHRGHETAENAREPLTYLILIADGLHNLLGGMAVGAAFLIDVRLGISTWIAAAIHEVPQELGDFAVLVHGGWPKRKALFYNFVSALAFLLGGIVAYLASARIPVAVLVPFAAGNFLYIGAADLIPEIKATRKSSVNVLHFLAFAFGLAVLLTIRLFLPEGA